MSAAFKIAKQKVSQNELRKLMNQQKAKSQQKVKIKIESPLAKYNESGQLMCILCKSIVKSEEVWKVHINAKLHKENILLAKQLKEKTHNFTEIAKRPASPLPTNETVPNKKIKSILKKSNNPSVTEEVNETSSKDNQNQIPSDFFDSDKSKNNDVNSDFKNGFDNMKIGRRFDNPKVEEDKDDIPEGFFDDPIMDAKVRHLDYKDPVEEEWDRFQREIKEAASLSNAIIAEDQEEATAERQIDEIDEQMRNWSRVLDLEKKKSKVIIAKKITENQMEVDDNSSDDEKEDNFNEFLDWRSKRSHNRR